LARKSVAMVLTGRVAIYAAGPFWKGAAR
jgi:hypothetical protein